MSTTYFTEEHEWIRVEGSTATVGITKYAQERKPYQRRLMRCR
jgi:glycine cleavage system H protein